MASCLPNSRASSENLRLSLLEDPSCPVSSSVLSVLDETVQAIEADGVAVNRLRAEVVFDDVRTVGMLLISAATSPGRTSEEFAALVRPQLIRQVTRLCECAPFLRRCLIEIGF